MAVGRLAGDQVKQVRHHGDVDLERQAVTRAGGEPREGKAERIDDRPAKVEFEGLFPVFVRGDDREHESAYSDELVEPAPLQEPGQDVDAFASDPQRVAAEIDHDESQSRALRMVFDVEALAGQAIAAKVELVGELTRIEQPSLAGAAFVEECQDGVSDGLGLQAWAASRFAVCRWSFGRPRRSGGSTFACRTAGPREVAVIRILAAQSPERRDDGVRLLVREEQPVQHIERGDAVLLDVLQDLAIAVGQFDVGNLRCHGGLPEFVADGRMTLMTVEPLQIIGRVQSAEFDGQTDRAIGVHEGRIGDFGQGQLGQIAAQDIFAEPSCGLCGAN